MKVVFVYEKGNDNEYHFKETIQDDNFSSGQAIEVNFNLLKDIFSKKNTTVSQYMDNHSDLIYFDVSKVFSDLIEQYHKDEPEKSEEELYKQVLDLLSKVFKNIKSVNVSNDNGITSYNLNFQEKKMTVNGEEENSSIKKSDVITEINMSEIDPEKVISKIKEKVISQDKTVETVLYNIYNNQKILESGNEDLLSSKANIILDGPTGTGKTFILKEVAKNLSIPMNITPADIFAAPGYKGAQLEEMLIPLLDQTDGNVELAERGIVVLDEFDKLCVKGQNALEMHKAVQHSLLTYIGGSKISLEYRGKNIEFDTSKLTFICLGAFTDLRERKIREGLDENNQYTIKPEDYIQEGMQRELVGRFSLVTATQSLDKNDMKKILLESTTSPIKNLQEIGRMYGKEIVFEDALVDRIAEEAVSANTGARALQTIVNGIENLVLSKIIDENADKEIFITSDYIDRYNEVYKRRVVK